MKNSLLIKAQLQIAEIFWLIQAEKEKEGWDKDPPWVRRGKNGQFGGGGSDTEPSIVKEGKKEIEKAKQELEEYKKTVEKYISTVQAGRDRLRKKIQNASEENRKKLSALIWSDGAKKARRDIGKSLDKHLPGASHGNPKAPRIWVNARGFWVIYLWTIVTC